MTIIPFISGASGLNQKDDPLRLSYSKKSGVSDLSIANNIDIDRTNRISRRPGFSLIVAGDFHSLFSDNGQCFVGRDTTLQKINTDLSLTGIRSGMTQGVISYSQANSLLLYSNGIDTGYVDNSQSFPWVAGVYQGTDTNRSFSGPVPGSHLAFRSGRTFIAEGPVLWWSEPYQPGVYDKLKGHVRFSSDIRMIAPVVAGLFVSDGLKTYFLRDQGDGSFLSELISNKPSVENTLANELIEGMEIGIDSPGLCRVWSAEDGVRVGLPSGQIINIDGKKVTRSGAIGHGAIRSDNQYIHQVGAEVFSTNLESRATTVYTGYDFNSITNFNGTLLGANSTGLYKLDGESDEGSNIDSEFSPITTDFGSDNPKRLRYLYLGMEATGDLEILLSADGGSPCSIPVSTTKTGLQHKRVSAPRRISGRYINVSIKNKSGAYFALDSLDILPIVRNHGIT